MDVTGCASSCARQLALASACQGHESHAAVVPLPQRRIHLLRRSLERLTLHLHLVAPEELAMVLDLGHRHRLAVRVDELGMLCLPSGPRRRLHP